MTALAAFLTARGRTRPSAPPSSGTDPYPLYPSFDRNELPFHVAAGSWGAQVPFQAPSPPVTTRQVTVTTQEQFQTEAAIAGTEITIGASFASSSQVNITADDIDVILPNAYTIASVIFGTGNLAGKSRMRIRKPVGESRGGRTGRLTLWGTGSGGGRHSDIIIDGVDNNGQSSFGNPGEDNQCFNFGDNSANKHQRLLIHNVRALCGASLGFMDVDHTLIARSSFRSSAVNRTTAGTAEGWCIRGFGTPMVIVDSHLETTRYHVIRPNTYDNANEYFYLARSTLYAGSEGKIGWLGNKLGDPAFGFWWGAWVTDCDIFSAATPTCISGNKGQLLDPSHSTYTRVRNNRIFSAGTGNDITWAGADLTTERNSAISRCNGDATLISRGRAPLPADAHSSDADLATNTFFTLTGRPAWGGAGDPTGITLPNGWSLNNGNTDGAYGSGICAAVW